MKAGDLIKIKNPDKANYCGKPFTVGRLVEIEGRAVKVIVEGIDGYFIFSKDYVECVIKEEECADEEA